MLNTSTPFHTNKKIHTKNAHTHTFCSPLLALNNSLSSPAHKYTQMKKFCVSTEHPHAHTPQLLRKMHYCSKSTYSCLISTYKGGCFKNNVCLCVWHPHDVMGMINSIDLIGGNY